MVNENEHVLILNTYGGIENVLFKVISMKEDVLNAFRSLKAGVEIDTESIFGFSFLQKRYSNVTFSHYGVNMFELYLTTS